jgi:hypothetical protein
VARGFQYYLRWDVKAFAVVQNVTRKRRLAIETASANILIIANSRVRNYNHDDDDDDGVNDDDGDGDRCGKEKRQGSSVNAVDNVQGNESSLTAASKYRCRSKSAMNGVIL